MIMILLCVLVSLHLSVKREKGNPGLGRRRDLNCSGSRRQYGSIIHGPLSRTCSSVRNNARRSFVYFLHSASEPAQFDHLPESSQVLATIDDHHHSSRARPLFLFHEIGLSISIVYPFNPFAQAGEYKAGSIATNAIAEWQHEYPERASQAKPALYAAIISAFSGRRTIRY
jgi:hypothetical protein